VKKILEEGYSCEEGKKYTHTHTHTHTHEGKNLREEKLLFPLFPFTHTLGCHEMRDTW
jgi:hypothetical protein